MSLTPMKESPSKKDESEGITVAIRMRPLNDNEENKERIWKVLPKYSSVTQTTRDGKPLSERVTGRTFFTFDKTFGEDTDNRKVYDSVAKGIVGSVVQGLNGTIFAYGQTSSGKTYTMQGSGSLEEGSEDGGEGGLVHMAARDIFSQIEKQENRLFLVRVSFLEIYNEEVRDLLAGSSQTLQIREDPRRGVFVQSVEEIVTDSESLLRILVQGDKSRTFAATGMNERSSRSHTILRVTIESREKGESDGCFDDDEGRIPDGDGAVRISTLNLVDLAGSESVRHTGATGERQKEGGLINQSLLTLSRVIVALGSPNQTHVNFRDSKLTRILQPSLSGNARMAVICCATPSELYLEETRSTLQFASRAKLVKTNAQVNEVLDERSMIRRLQRELAEAKRNQSGVGDQQFKEMEKQVATAGTQAMEAKAKLDRLKASILNAGYLFDQPIPDAAQSESLPIIRTSKKRRKSDGPLMIGQLTPLKETNVEALSPKTAPRPKRTHRLQNPTLPANQELRLVQEALSVQNRLSRELTGVVKCYVEQIREKEAEIEIVQAENSSLNNRNCEANDKLEKLHDIVHSLQDSLQTSVRKNEELLEEKELQANCLLEKLERLLAEKKTLEEKLLELQVRFDEVHQERIRSAFELAEMTTKRETLAKEAADDKIKLQEMAGKTEFLTSNLNEAMKERDDALLLANSLQKENENIRRANIDIQRDQEIQISELDDRIKKLEALNNELQGANDSFQTELHGSRQEILSLQNNVSSLERKLARQQEQHEAERESIEYTLRETTAEASHLRKETMAKQNLIVDLENQLMESSALLQVQVEETRDHKRKLEDMIKEIRELETTKEGVEQLVDVLQEKLDDSLKSNSTLSDEKEQLLTKLSIIEGENTSLNAKLERHLQGQAALEQENHNLSERLEIVGKEKREFLARYEASQIEHKKVVEEFESVLTETQKELESAKYEKQKLVSSLAELEQSFAEIKNNKDALEDSLNLARKETDDAERALQSKIQCLSSLGDEKDLLLAEKNSMQALLHNCQGTISNLETQIEAAEGQILRLQLEKQSAIVASKQSLAKIQSIWAELTAKKNEIDTLEHSKWELERKLEERKVEIDSMVSKISETQEALISMNEEKNRSCEQLEAKQMEMLELRLRVQSTKVQLDETTSEIRLLLDSNKKKDLQIKDLLDMSGRTKQEYLLKMSLLENEIGSLRERLRHFEEESVNNKLAITEKESRLNKILEEKEELLSQVKELRSVLGSRNDALKDAALQLSQVIAEKEDLMSRHVELEYKLQDVESLNHMLEKQGEVVSSLEKDCTESIAKCSEMEELLISRDLEYKAANDKIASLQAELETAKTRATSLKAQNDEMMTKLAHVNEAEAQAKEELKQILASRETLMQSLRECEAERDEASAEVQKLYEKNRHLADSIACSFPSERVEELKAELSDLKNQNIEVQQLLASVNESDTRMRGKVLHLENELKLKCAELDDLSLKLSQRDEEIVKGNSDHAEKTTLELSHVDFVQRIETLQKDNATLTEKLRREKEAWKSREEELLQQMGEEQRVLLQEGEIMLSNLRRELQQCESKLSQAESEAYTARQQVEELGDERRNLDQRYFELQERVKALDVLNAQQNCQILELRNELSNAKSDCYALKESSIDMKEKMRRSKRDNEKMMKESEKAAEDIATLRKKVTTLEKQIESSQIENSRLRKTITQIEKNEMELKRLEEDLETKIHDIKDLHSKIKVLEREKKEEFSTAEKTQITRRVASNDVEVKRLVEEMKQKDLRIKKLEAVRMTKDQMAKIKSIKTANQELETKCSILQDENKRLNEKLLTMGTDSELRAEVSELRFDKEALERKLRKFASHCQRLEDDKAGMADALRSCSIDIEAYDNDISEAIIHLCDRFTSMEQRHSSQPQGVEASIEMLQQENDTLRQKIDTLTEKLNQSTRYETKEFRRDIKTKSTGIDTEEFQQKLAFLENENLQLIRDLKLAREALHKTRRELENVRVQVKESQTIDFVGLGIDAASTSSVPGLGQDTAELTRMARTFSASPLPKPMRDTRNSKMEDEMTRKRPILSDSTNHAGSRESIAEISDSKRQRVCEVTKSIRERRKKAASTASTLSSAPGLGESSSLGNSESTGECTQS
ncbi:kinesin motor domain containing protein [Nitzschia inconspicua]|uniref:Kinesin motor domain containing protein n=1 Tax=Nitzschia inconspicua TaxID=303405 RepID=A0A9K3KQ99_9STRA|nr:kinesin motor domain containing protein [Nitzschia inconspicua]